MKAIHVSVPATSANLGAGFDTLGLALELRNEVWLRRGARRGVHYVVEGEGCEDVAREPRANLFDRVLRRSLARLDHRAPDLEVRMLNRIPWRRGLGSSSAAAVAGAAAALRLAGVEVTEQAVLDLALPFEGHPDNLAPAAAGGFTVATLDGKRARFVRLAPPDLQAIALVPSFGVSTATARKLLPKTVPLGDAVHNLTRAALAVAAVSSRRWDLLGLGTEDRLHQPYRARLVPGFDRVRLAAARAGAVAAFLSGSGPTILALARRDDAPAVEAAMRRAWARHGRGEARLLGLAPARRGAVVHGQLTA